MQSTACLLSDRHPASSLDNHTFDSCSFLFYLPPYSQPPSCLSPLQHLATCSMAWLFTRQPRPPPQSPTQEEDERRSPMSGRPTLPIPFSMLLIQPFVSLQFFNLFVATPSFNLTHFFHSLQLSSPHQWLLFSCDKPINHRNILFHSTQCSSSSQLLYQSIV